MSVQSIINSAALGEDFVVEKALKTGQVDPNAADPKGYTLLHTAINCKQEGVVQIVLNFNPDVNRLTRDQSTPIHLAAGIGNAKIVSMLVQKKADLERKDKNGNTALLAALEGLDPEGVKACVEILLAAGANVNVKNNANRTALILAAKGGHSESAKAILAKGADANAKDSLGMTARDYGFAK